jgi:hypothetical protein
VPPVPLPAPPPALKAGVVVAAKTAKSSAIFLEIMMASFL